MWSGRRGGLSDHDRKKLERMRDEVFNQPTIKAFLEAQQSFITELQELNRYTTERLGLDFAHLAKPQTGFLMLVKIHAFFSIFTSRNGSPR